MLAAALVDLVLLFLVLYGAISFTRDVRGHLRWRRDRRRIAGAYDVPERMMPRRRRARRRHDPRRDTR